MRIPQMIETKVDELCLSHCLQESHIFSFEQLFLRSVCSYIYL